MISVTRIETDKAVVVYYHTVWGFLKSVLKMTNFKFPVWKVICPRPDNPKVGAVYYIVKQDLSTSHVFRGTYGYYGTGCHESALIEKMFEMLKFPITVRDGDYLLTLLFWVS